MFKIGDKVKLLVDKRADYWKFGVKGAVFTVVSYTNDHNHMTEDQIECAWLNASHKYIFELYKEESEVNKEFTKDMLTTGMRVVHRNGMVGIVLKDINIIVYDDGFNNLDDTYFENNIDETNYSYEIVKVYSGYQQSMKVLNFEALGELLWERKEETEQQKQIKELEATIKKAQEQINKIKEGL